MTEGASIRSEMELMDKRQLLRPSPEQNKLTSKKWTAYEKTALVLIWEFEVYRQDVKVKLNGDIKAIKLSKYNHKEMRLLICSINVLVLRNDG